MSSPFFQLLKQELRMAHKYYRQRDSALYAAGTNEGRQMDCRCVWAALTIQEIATIVKSSAGIKSLPGSLQGYLHNHRDVRDSVYRMINRPLRIRGNHRLSIQEWKDFILGLPVWDTKTKKSTRLRAEFAGVDQDLEIAALLNRPATRKRSLRKPRRESRPNFSVDSSLEWIREKIASREILNANQLVQHPDGGYHYRFLRQAKIANPFKAAMGWRQIIITLNDFTNRELLDMMKAEGKILTNTRRLFLKRLKILTHGNHAQAFKLLGVLQSIVFDHSPGNRIVCLSDQEIKILLEFAEIKTEKACKEFLPSLYHMLRRMRYVEEKFYEIWFPAEFDRRRQASTA